MHELSIAESIVEIATEYAGRENVAAFQSIELEIGSLSGIEIDALTFAMEVVCRNTVLNEAKVLITKVAGIAFCADCGVEFQVDDYFNPCPSCGNVCHTLQQGDELRVKSLTVNE